MRWAGILARFDKPTVDGRKLAKPTEVTTPGHELPLREDVPLLAFGSDRHQIGTVTRVWVDGDLLCGEGEWTYKPPPAGASLSVGLDLDNGDWITVNPELDLIPGVRMIMYGWRIAGLTVYVDAGEPAFPDARIEVIG